MQVAVLRGYLVTDYNHLAKDIDRRRSMMDSAPVGSVGATGGLLGYSPPRPRTSMLNFLSMSPVFGDVAGPLLDIERFKSDPGSRTATNALMFAAGLLPAVPSLGWLMSRGGQGMRQVPQSQSGVIGYHGAPQDDALRLAQQRAALPVEQYGLGLPADNTQAQRAAAMGFDTPAFHATDARDIASFDNNLLGSNTRHNTGGDKWAVSLAKKGHWLSDRDLTIKGANGSRMFGDVVYPVMLKSPDKEFSSLDKFSSARKIGAINKVADEEFNATSYVVPNSDNIRSRFAAFDPWRRNTLIAAGLGVAAPDLLAKENDPGKREARSSKLPKRKDKP